MSAAFQLPMVWGASSQQRAWGEEEGSRRARPATQDNVRQQAKAAEAVPAVSVAFYRKHTEKMLRRYLYASMQVGRTPSILGEPIGRGWCSSRPVKTFEDAVIFVLDVETCLNQLDSLDRQLLSRVVLQEYTQAETATLLGMSVRSVCTKLAEAVDRLTEKLLKTGSLVIPNSCE
jgi:hypothetical protein